MPDYVTQVHFACRSFLLSFLMTLVLATCLWATPAEINVALNKTVTPHTNTASGTVQGIVDGDYSTFWYSYEYISGAYTFSFSLDLRSVYNISKIVFQPLQSRTYMIESSLDGANWTPRHSDTYVFNDNSVRELAINNPYQARYLRYTSTNNDVAYCGMVEFEVYTPLQSISFAGGDGSALDPWQISTPAELDHVRYFLGAANVDKHFVLVNDLDLDVAPFNLDPGWEPIGSYVRWLDPGNAPFTGSFDGGGFTIRNLHIKRPAAEGVGLFGLTDGATIKNLSLAAEDIAGSTYVGGLIGLAFRTSVTDVHTAGTILANGAGRGGGLVGMAVEGTSIVDSSSSCRVDVPNSTNAGGLVAQLEGSSIRRSWATGAVNCGQDLVGGLVGEARYTCNISQSYATGDVSGDGDVGGLVGAASATTIGDCYATGAVTNVGLRSGGLAGYIGPDASVIRSYATGLVDGPQGTGGLVGGLTGTVAASFYDSTTSGQVDTGKGDGISSAALQQESNFSGWDFSEVWGVSDGATYPYLRWQAIDSIVGITTAVFPDDGSNVRGGHSVTLENLAVTSTVQSKIAGTTSRPEASPQTLGTRATLDDQIWAFAFTDTNGQSRCGYESYDASSGQWQEISSTLASGSSFEAGHIITIEDGVDGLQLRIETPVSDQLRF
ncbi:MAG: hypothetical protein Kow00100_23890 [Geothermobacteraceae bacterium]